AEVAVRAHRADVRVVAQPELGRSCDAGWEEQNTELQNDTGSLLSSPHRRQSPITLWPLLRTPTHGNGPHSHPREPPNLGRLGTSNPRKRSAIPLNRGIASRNGGVAAQPVGGGCAHSADSCVLSTCFVDLEADHHRAPYLAP